jgi:hypothetical protein
MSKMPTIVQMSPWRGTASPFGISVRGSRTRRDGWANLARPGSPEPLILRERNRGRRSEIDTSQLPASMAVFIREMRSNGLGDFANGTGIVGVVSPGESQVVSEDLCGDGHRDRCEPFGEAGRHENQVIRRAILPV